MMVLQATPSFTCGLGRLPKTAMSDSDDMEFHGTQTPTSASEDEGQRGRTRKSASRRAPLPKRPSLQKRKKPARIQHRASKAVDPFDDDALFKPSDTMDEEMNAMKQVFLHMSEKKVQQKEERKADCKRLYKETFHADVEQTFHKAAKRRSKIMDSVSEEIDDVKIKLKVASKNLMSAHNNYKEAFKLELVRAASEIETLRGIQSDLEVQYVAAKKSINIEYDEVTQAMELSLQQLEVRLIEAYDDKSYLGSFQSQIERLL